MLYSHQSACHAWNPHQARDKLKDYDEVCYIYIVSSPEWVGGRTRVAFMALILRIAVWYDVKHKAIPQIQKRSLEVTQTTGGAVACDHHHQQSVSMKRKTSGMWLWSQTGNCCLCCVIVTSMNRLAALGSQAKQERSAAKNLSWDYWEESHATASGFGLDWIGLDCLCIVIRVIQHW